MGDAVQLIEHIIINKFLHSDVPFLGRTAGERVLLALFVLFLALGLMFLVFALYLWLKVTQSPEIAAALTGAGAFILALALGGVQLLILWLKARKIRSMKRDIEALVREILSSAHDEVGATVRDNPKSSTLLALVLGLLVGERVF